MLNIALRQKRNMISDDDALRELEIASSTWRGDSIEVKNLGMLSQLYAAKGRYSDAFAVGRTATKLQPNSEISRKVQDQTSALFDQLYQQSQGRRPATGRSLWRCSTSIAISRPLGGAAMS